MSGAPSFTSESETQQQLERGVVIFDVAKGAMKPSSRSATWYRHAQSDGNALTAPRIPHQRTCQAQRWQAWNGKLQRVADQTAQDDAGRLVFCSHSHNDIASSGNLHHTPKDCARSTKTASMQENKACTQLLGQLRVVPRTNGADFTERNNVFHARVEL